MSSITSRSALQPAARLPGGFICSYVHGFEDRTETINHDCAENLFVIKSLEKKLHYPIGLMGPMAKMSTMDPYYT